jgi:ABC-type transport system involved in multi-copper enzyme maturation permease subunit
MTQTLALLLDAYRELNARKMFWISLIISGVVIAGFALLGVNDKGMTLLWIELPVPAAKFFYKWVFSSLVIFWWISLGAMVLALISTASIFPDLLVGGSIDLYLAKPLSRLRLFLTKYFGGLLFVVLQTTVFAVGSYFVFGFRAGLWRPSLFLIIPLATLLFSYLYAVCVLLGVMTRSTIAAILITCLFWALCVTVNAAERTLFAIRAASNAQVHALEKQISQTDREIADLKNKPSFMNAFGVRERSLRKRRDEMQHEADDSKVIADKLLTAYRIVRGIATVVPKTGETIDLLDRKIFSDEDLAELREEVGSNGGGGGPFGPRRARRNMPDAPPAPSTAHSTTRPTTSATEASVAAEEERRQMEQDQATAREVQEETERAARSRSIDWIIGTSLGFEAVMMGLAAWVFCRRDY